MKSERRDVQKAADIANSRFEKGVVRQVRIKAPADRLWQVISVPGNLESCHPFCAANPVTKWPGEGSVDWVIYYNGLRFKRHFISWMEGRGYDLLIGREGGRQSRVEWRIAALNAAECRLTITILPHGLDRYPRLITKLFYALYVRPMLGRYLDSVLKGYKWYLEQGRPVEKNQFGRHRWFSYS